MCLKIASDEQGEAVKAITIAVENVHFCSDCAQTVSPVKHKMRIVIAAMCSYVGFSEGTNCT